MPRIGTGRYGHVVVGAVYAALVVGYTWPLPFRLGEVVPHDLGDPLLTIWTLWWNAQTLPFTAGWWDGPAFHPVSGTLAFSDHRVGLGAIATPLILSGVSPLAAYNVVFLLSFFLSAVAAYGLAWALTRQRMPAFVAGLAFAFHPYRAAHLEHLELLATFCLPAVFWSLHCWRAHRSTAALCAVAGSLTALALTSGYYFVFCWVLIGLWVMWFEVRVVTRAEVVKLGLALAAPLAVVAPVLLRYRAIHGALGLRRSVTEIESMSADIVDVLVVPDALWFWPQWLAATHPERALFPGITAITIVALALWSRREPATELMPRVRRLCLVIGLMALAAAAVAAWTGGFALSLGAARLSVQAAYKPLSIAALAFGGWILSAPSVVGAWRRASPLAFYALASILMALFALGPTAHAGGARVLYKAPYAWLMLLPGFADSLRVPARFAMLAALTLSAAVAVAMAGWRQHRHGVLRRAAWAAAVFGVLADGWIGPLALHPPPAPLELPASLRADDVIVELPTGVYEDAAAMYRATLHGRRIVNGMSGYDPPHYLVLKQALREGDVDALEVLSVADELVTFVVRGPQGDEARSRLLSASWATQEPSTVTHDVFRVGRRSTSQPASGRPLALARVEVSTAPATAGALLDGDERSVWQTPAQRGGEFVVLDLGVTAPVSGASLDHGALTHAYPRALRVEHSPDGQQWSLVWQGRTAALVVAGALAAPRLSPLDVRFAVVSTRFLRLTQTATSDQPWAVAGARVYAP